MKTLSGKILLTILAMVLMLSSFAAAPAPQQPNVTIEIVNGLPTTLNLGETYTVEIQVTSDVPFNFATAMPDPYYPGRYVVFSQGENRSGAGTSATLYLTMTAKDATAPIGGAAPLGIVVGTRFKNGIVVAERFDFAVTVP